MRYNGRVKAANERHEMKKLIKKIRAARPVRKTSLCAFPGYSS